MKKVKFSPESTWLSSFYQRFSKRKQRKQKYLIYLKNFDLDLQSPYMNGDTAVPIMCPLVIIETLPYAEAKVREFFETSGATRDLYDAEIIDIEYQSEGVSNLILSSEKINALYRVIIKKFSSSWDYIISLPRIIRGRSDFVPKVTVKGSEESLRYLIGRKLRSLRVSNKQNYNEKIASFV